MKKFSSKALLGALTTIGTIAGATAMFGITHQAHANIAINNNSTQYIPVELGLSSNNYGTYSTTGLVLTFNQAVSGTVVVTLTLNNATFEGSFSLIGSSQTAPCNLTSNSYEASCTFDSISAQTSYTAGIIANSTTNPIKLDILSSNNPVVISATDPVEQGSFTLFGSYTNYSVIVSSSSAQINTSLTVFTSGGNSSGNSSVNSASNSIIISSNSNPFSLTVSSGSINAIFTNIPGSVAKVTTINSDNCGNNGVPSNGYISCELSPYNSIPLNTSSATYSFTFSNTSNQNIIPGTIDLSVIGSGINSASNGSGTITFSSSVSYTYINNYPFLSFVQSSLNIYGNMVYIPVGSGYAERLWISIPSNVSLSNFTLMLGSSSCQTSLTSLSQDAAPTTFNGITTYLLDLTGNVIGTCALPSSISEGQLVPIQITAPLSSALSQATQASANIYVNTNGVIKHLPLTISTTSLSTISY